MWKDWGEGRGVKIRGYERKGENEKAVGDGPRGNVKKNRGVR